MAENRVSIIISAKNMASDALNQVKTGFNNLGESSKTYQRTLSEVNGTMSSAMSTAMRFAGIINHK
ncbi:hypothetical protein [Desulforegula conservatrix]|uniref:hypothetical protein n=1 Tax=Desulforegula conservatrix TaxID=153026 RepID=UPI0004135DED|nr:hypothetical protein [Desulforegula conservatrix]